MSRQVDSAVIFIARVALSLLFLWGGIEKAIGYAGFVAYLQAKHVPLVLVAAPIATVVEILGGMLLIVGFLTKPLGPAMAAFTLLSGVLGHDFWNALDPAMRHAEMIQFCENVCIAGGFLLLLVTGAGAISIDAVRVAKPRLLEPHEQKDVTS